MTASLPTPADSTDTARIEAGHRAVDALNNLIGEMRGLLEHDPDAARELIDALAVVLAPDQPGIVRHDHRRTLSVRTDRDSIAVLDRWADEDTQPQPIWLTAGQAEDLACTLLAAAAATRQAADQ